MDKIRTVMCISMCYTLYMNILYWAVDILFSRSNHINSKRNCDVIFCCSKVLHVG